MSSESSGGGLGKGLVNSHRACGCGTPTELYSGAGVTPALGHKHVTLTWTRVVIPASRPSWGLGVLPAEALELGRGGFVLSTQLKWCPQGQEAVPLSVTGCLRDNAWSFDWITCDHRCRWSTLYRQNACINLIRTGDLESDGRSHSGQESSQTEPLLLVASRKPRSPSRDGGIWGQAHCVAQAGSKPPPQSEKGVPPHSTGTDAQNTLPSFIPC